MKITPKKINAYTFFKLPLAWWGGVRVKEISENSCTVYIKHRWINQNPFKSMFWAAQGMAAEMTTGALVRKKIVDSGRKVSMLVKDQRANFSKKATGLIRFECHDGKDLANAIEKSAKSGEGVVVVMKSTGYNPVGVEVSSFEFEWSLRVKE
jgi:GTP cyclohydrolase II